MTPEGLTQRLDALEKQLIQQERIRDGAKEQYQQARIAVGQLQGACAILRELIAKETQPAVPAGANGPEPVERPI